ncbi:MAG: DUF4350 domain-containing protein [Acidimicrobiales bacterium]
MVTLVLLAVVVLGVAALAGRPVDDDRFDPRSTAPAGARGLVEFLEASGVDVSEGWPDDRTDVALVGPAPLSADDAARATAWADAGGHLILLGGVNAPFEETILPTTTAVTNGPACQIPALDDVGRVSETSGLVVLTVPGDDGVQRCLGTAGSGWLVTERPWGKGRITTVASAVPFTNARLAEADNAVLAGRLLAADPAPGAGSTRLSFLYLPPAGPANGTGLSDLVSDNVRWYGWQLAVAVGLLLFWAVRRFGDPVAEPPVVELPGSLAVLATGQLHQLNEDLTAAYHSTRQDVVDRLRRHYRLSPDTPPDLLVDTVSADTGLDPATLRSLIVAPPDTDLLHAATRLDRVARQVLNPTPVTSPAGPVNPSPADADPAGTGRAVVHPTSTLPDRGAADD